ncbi:response regulator [Sphingomonas sp. A2-49]|uniref:MHYT domain-containing protein n=1 Tax=Sphingomonas sp. A2-49 TaxID=1391375 RepID=UPI0021CFC904|nr:MHYT domain-containing protein [Sphingomonas sp. A2-49]MCU6456127.1 response regulator [Sphingomonas sp. A2-49]
MPGTYDEGLVALSILIAIVASYTALDLAGRIRASEGSVRHAWLTTSALAMGGGIWAMHFVAMLSYRMAGVSVSYDAALTLASLLVAILATGISFAVIGAGAASVAKLLAAGTFMGIGVAAMHYLGMAGMRMHATIAYDGLWVSASVAIAVCASTVALFLSGRSDGVTHRVSAAIVMGVAIAGMHFAGMKAATFMMSAPSSLAAEASSLSSTTIALTISAAALLILFLALIAAMFDRRFAAMAAREAEALKISEERFKALYRGTPLPLHSLDEAGRIEHVSDAWLRLTGYDRAEVVGRPLINFLTEASARQARKEDRPMLMRDGALTDREYRIVTKGGDVRDVVASARVEMTEDGVFQHILGGLTDVTDRKIAEEGLRQAQKVEAIGQLTGGIAHDFNNLLAVVIGNLDLLSRQVDEGSRARRLVDNAMAGAQRGASLTQRLLAFARRQDLRPERVDVPALVRGLSDMLERSLGPLVHIDTRFPLRLPPVHVDAHQLELAVLNMAVNARDAMPEGGTLTISAADDILPADAAFEGGRFVRLELTDDGVGMDADTLRRAAEPFFTTKGLGKGTGLGLSMVHGLAAQSGGRIRIDSTAGVGTTISLWLPQASAVDRRRSDGPSNLIPDVPPLSILAVDDDELVLANTAAMLEDLGHHVMTATSGAEALRHLKTMSHCDLLVTDQLMPNMTGVQVGAEARAFLPGLPVLLVSGFAELDGQHLARFEFLHKPFDRTALAQAVARTYALGKIVRLDDRRSASAD